MSKIFIVTSGEYSDYGIRAVFSTRKIAEEFIEKAKSLKDEEDYPVVYWSQYAQVEEYEVDADLRKDLVDYWHVGMLLDDGSVVEPRSGGGGPYKEFCEPFKSRIEQFGDKVPAYKNRPIVRVKSTISFEHAVKVAAEKRQEWLRSNSVTNEQAQ